VVDLLLAQRRQELAGDARRVAVAVPGGEAVARVPGAVGEVQIADVAEPDDGSLRGR
jgi:hypothetical protein